jgi:hypothetical protein
MTWRVDLMVPVPSFRSWPIIDDEVETAIGLHALVLLYNRIDQA